MIKLKKGTHAYIACKVGQGEEGGTSTSKWWLTTPIETINYNISPLFFGAPSIHHHHEFVYLAHMCFIVPTHDFFAVG
jgi:hypothetical protein